MTAPNPNSFAITNRRLSRLLAFLSMFLVAVVVLAVGSHKQWFGPGPATTFYDPKGILTGPGTFLVLIGAALAALLLFVAYKKWTLKGTMENPSAALKTDENALRALTEWLALDVLNAAPNTATPSRVEGHFRNRALRIERIEVNGSARVRLTIQTASSLALKVWWLGKMRADVDGPRESSAFATADPQFENCCAWQASAPNDALAFLNRSDVTGTLHRVCFISGRNENGDDIGVTFERDRIVLITRMPSREFMHATSALVLLQDLVFLADAAESKSTHSILAGTVAFGKELGDPTSAAPLQKKSAIMSFLSCLMFIVFILVPLAAMWIAGSYYCAKALDMSAGMICFFLPVLLLAIFVFTRPTAPENDADAANDIDTVRAAALKFWEETLRTDPDSARLLDIYERRLRELKEA